MNNLLLTVQKNKYLLICIAIILLATFLRFYNYENRWGLAYDQAHDALVSRYAVEEKKLPLLGPFSSAGPFQTGGQWYWLIMIPIFIYPYSVLSPWIFITLLSVAFVGVMIFIGNKLEGRFFSVIVGLFACVSTAQIAQAVSLTNQSPHALLSALGIASMIYFIKTKKTKFLFLIGVLVSLSATIHLQGVALILLLVTTILFTKTFSLKKITIVALGACTALIPILLYDLQHDFFNIKNMYQYYLFDQYKISLDVLGRRWLTYGGIFIPRSWAYVIGGFPPVGYVGIIGSGLMIVYAVFKKKLSKEWFILAVAFAGMVGILKYTRTPLFDSYLVFLHPFIILLTSLFVLDMYRFNRIVGLTLCIGIVTTSLYKDIPELKGSFNYAAFISNNFKNALTEKYPNEKFAIYDHRYSQKDKSLPLVLFLDGEGKINDNGHKIGIYIQTMQYVANSPVIKGEKGEYQLVDLDSYSTFDLSKDQWVFVNPSEIYRTTEEWYTKK